MILLDKGSVYKKKDPYRSRKIDRSHCYVFKQNRVSDLKILIWDNRGAIGNR
jgi:hypothetical protein